MILEVLVVLLFIIIPAIVISHEWPSTRTCKFVEKLGGPSYTFLFGHTITIARVKIEDIIEFMSNMCQEYGPVFRLWFLNIPFVILNDGPSMEALLNSVNHIEKGLMYKVFDKWLNEGLLISKGSKWHSRRKLLTPTFHFKILEDCLPIFNKHAHNITEELSSINNTVVEIEPYISKYTLFIVCEAAMGISLANLPDKGGSYLKATLKVNNINMRRMYSPWLFRDCLFDITLTGWEFNKHLKVLHSFTKMVINERRQHKNSENVNNGSIPENKRHKNFLDCLLEVNENNPDFLNIDDIREEVDTFMFEGHDTTSAAISAALYMLGHNQEVQDMAFKELHDVFGNSDRDATKDDLNNLTYMDRVIKETLRMFPSVPAMSRKLTNDLNLPHLGKLVPADTNILFFPFCLHRNPEYFPDPEKFDPDRFLPEEVQKRHPFSYIPFSGGPRNCIGQKFAKMEMKIVLSAILRKLKIESVTKREDVKMMPSVILRPQFPFKVKLIKRQ